MYSLSEEVQYPWCTKCTVKQDEAHARFGRCARLAPPGAPVGCVPAPAGAPLHLMCILAAYGPLARAPGQHLAWV